MRSPLPGLALVLVLIGSAGCGGLAPCGGADWGSANPAYAGHYVGGYYPRGAPGGLPPALSFDLTVAASGAITGTATETSSGNTAAVTGTVIDAFFACSPDKTDISMDFTLPSEAADHFIGNRSQGMPVHWPFDSSVNGGSGQSTGTLLMDKS